MALNHRSVDVRVGMRAEAEVGKVTVSHEVRGQAVQLVPLAADAFDLLAKFRQLLVVDRIVLDHLDLSATVAGARGVNHGLPAFARGRDVQPVLRLETLDHHRVRVPAVGGDDFARHGDLDARQQRLNVPQPLVGIVRRARIFDDGISPARRRHIGRHCVEVNAVEPLSHFRRVDLRHKLLITGVADVHHVVVARRPPEINRDARGTTFARSGVGVGEVAKFDVVHAAVPVAVVARIPTGTEPLLARIFCQLRANMKRHLGVPREMAEAGLEVMPALLAKNAAGRRPSSRARPSCR